MFNEVSSMLFDMGYLNKLNNQLNELRKYGSAVEVKGKENEVTSIKEKIEQMSKDPTISDIRERCTNINDLTYEDIAYVGATYTEGYWPRPDDAHYEAKRILIMNGNNTSKGIYYDTPRAKKIKITIENKDYILELKDTPECQIFDLNYKTTQIDKPLEIQISILDWYKGNRNTAVPEDGAFVSEIQFEIEQTVFVGGR
jgi:hypothetical protein